MHERLTGGKPTAGPPASDQVARGQLGSWRAGYGPDGAGRFAARLSATGLDEESLLAVLTEAPERVAARIPRPDWARDIEAAMRTAAPDPDEPVPGDWRAAFAVPLRPLVDAAAERLATECAGSAQVDLPAVLAGFAGGLRARLVDLAARTFVVELGERRIADFIRQLATPAGLADLFTRYPVLARLLGQAARQEADAHVELLTRFAADRPAIVSTLLGGTDPGPLVAIEAGRGDRHARGRAVAIVGFGSGARVVYRPRDVEPQLRMGAVVNWVNRRVPDLDLRTVTALARSGYGWLAFVPARPVADLAAADRFYRRQGALLALLHALHAGDMHHENLVAGGEWPVLVDVETLFHPTVIAANQPPDSAAAMLAESVHRTALLPMILVREDGVTDQSGLAGGPGGSGGSGGHNRPRLDGRELDLDDHEPALLDGFRLGYDAILRHADEFTALLAGCGDLDVRLIIRPTRGYVRLLDESTHPDLLRDAADRDRMLDALWTESADYPLRWQVSPHELADLWAGDVPLFTTRPGSLDVWTSAGTRLPGLLERTGLRHALDKVAGLSEVDRRDQEWIISATLATRRAPGGHHTVEPAPGPVAGTAAHPERLLAAACAIGDKIVAASLVDGGRVNWLGLEFVDNRQWLVLPMGAGLANGYPGVALFLAQLSEVSGIPRYADVAASAIGGLPQLLDVVDGRPHMVSLIGSGALHGFGGIAYALARLATLLGDAEVRRWARTCAAHAADADAASPDGATDWATGSAGCLMSLISVRAELCDLTLDETIRFCAQRLAERTDAGAGAGFTFGPAGAGWALAQASGFASAARAAIDRAGTPDRTALGWCSGLAGLAVARAGVGAIDDGVLCDLADRPVLRDLSLCHGELGIVEALTVLAGRVPDGPAVRRRRTGLVLDAIDRYGPSCGTPGAVPTPGLVSGLAGIGYGLLRLGFADRVPSVLLLEPTSPGSG